MPFNTNPQNPQNNFTYNSQSFIATTISEQPKKSYTTNYVSERRERR